VVPSQAGSARAKSILDEIPSVLPLIIPSGASSARARPLVLIADEDLASRELILAYLESAGCESVTGHSGPELIEMASEVLPDVIILDILQPDRKGWEMVKSLKGHPVTARIPIIAVTVVDESETSLATGADEYLLKPITEADILEAIWRRAPIRRNMSRVFFGVDDEPNARLLSG
jgi:CheY-like chemotaxis protein